LDEAAFPPSRPAKRRRVLRPRWAAARRPSGAPRELRLLVSRRRLRDILLHTDKEAFVELGYALSSEEHGPLDLAGFAREAEDCGFSFAMVSDHFHPWLDAQGESPFVWSVLGAIAVRTERLRVGTGVTCPLLRTHPAVVAHAAATTATMMPGRFFLGLGTGENLNEHILGDRWPSADERRDMLREAVAVMRALWTGDLVSHRGDHYRLVDARLYTLPEEPVEVVVAAGGKSSAELAAHLGEGIVTTSPDESLVEAFEASGGTGRKIGQLTVSWAPSEEEAIETAMQWWPNAALRGPLSQELPLPRHFEASVAMVSEEDIAKAVTCGPDPGPILDGIRAFAQAGFEEVYIHQVGPDQRGFLRFARDQLVPALAATAV
jgi:G6PDH family F420-dependent oxidoreductase